MRTLEFILISLNTRDIVIGVKQIEVYSMGVSYKKLWKLLIDRDMKKLDLCEAADVSTATVAKLGKGENVNTDILVRICIALDCELSDICEIVHDNNRIGHEVKTIRTI